MFKNNQKYSVYIEILLEVAITFSRVHTSLKFTDLYII